MFSDGKTRNAAQWMAAWALLPLAHRLAIVAFCVDADVDVADVALAVNV